jgi:hypothetical protein
MADDEEIIDDDLDGDIDEDIDEDLDEDIDDIDEDVDDEIDDEYVEDDDIDDDDDDDDDGDDEDEDEDEDAPAALDELEAEELDIVDEPTPQTMLVDEASEIRAIRRQELTVDVEAESPQSNEFVCSSCFLVLKRSQLANKRKMLCVDCA